MSHCVCLTCMWFFNLFTPQGGPSYNHPHANSRISCPRGGTLPSLCPSVFCSGALQWVCDANFRNSGAPLEFKVEAMSLSMFSMCDIVFLFKSHSLLYRKFVHQHNKDHHLFSKEKMIQTCQTCGGTKESN